MELKYKSKKVELTVGQWQMPIICPSCARKDVLSTQTTSWRTVGLQVVYIDETKNNSASVSYYCSLHASDALAEIFGKLATTLRKPSIDYEAMNTIIKADLN